MKTFLLICLFLVSSLASAASWKNVTLTQFRDLDETTPFQNCLTSKVLDKIGSEYKLFTFGYFDFPEDVIAYQSVIFKREATPQYLMLHLQMKSLNAGGWEYVVRDGLAGFSKEVSSAVQVLDDSTRYLWTLDLNCEQF